jgi:ATP/maltotriose-dependent transcriptional regulator MalT
MVGALLYGDDRLEDARAEWELAFRELDDAGRPCDAARVALHLAELHSGSLGNRAAGKGWLERARRILDDVGPCVEWGYWELALIACDRPDVAELEQSADRAHAIALEHRDRALEVRALADGGYALVSQGRVREGFDRLDEALAMLTSGEVHDPFVLGTSFCALLSSCDRAGDTERAREWERVVHEVVLGPMEGRPRVLSTHCHVALGGVLCAAGRLSEAETAILAALGPEGSVSKGHRYDATARLAELRIHQGRIDDAAELLAPMEDHVSAALPLATVHLLRGEPALAAAVARRAVRQLVGDVLRGAPLLDTLVVAEIERGELVAAQEAADLLATMAAAVDTPLVSALAAIARGRIALASGEADAAVPAFDAALADLAALERPGLVAVVHLDLTQAHAALDATDAAIAAARAAHSAARRLGARLLTDRSAEAMRSLGVTPPREVRPIDASGLTAREREVLDGICRGDSNAQIAAALFLSPKTVEHHVSRVLTKLGVRTRAEAAARAARSGTG